MSLGYWDVDDKTQKVCIFQNSTFLLSVFARKATLGLLGLTLVLILPKVGVGLVGP